MITSWGVLVEPRIYFSATFDSLSQCPALLSFFAHQRCILAVHDVTVSVCGDFRYRARNPAIKIANVWTRCYYCDSDQNCSCTLSLRVGNADSDHTGPGQNSQTDKTETADVSQNLPVQADPAEVQSRITANTDVYSTAQTVTAMWRQR